MGSIVTGFFAWKAGHRQTAATEAAGQAQAAALVSTVRATLVEQRRDQAVEQQQMYAEFLDAAQCCQIERAEETGSRLLRAESMVHVVGPAAVATASSKYCRFALLRSPSDQEKGDAEDARVEYISAVRRALEQP